MAEWELRASIYRPTGQKRTHDEAFADVLFNELEISKSSSSMLHDPTPATGYRLLQILASGAEDEVNREYADRNYDQMLVGPGAKQLYVRETTNLKAQVLHSQGRLRQTKDDMASLNTEIRYLKDQVSRSQDELAQLQKHKSEACRQVEELQEENKEYRVFKGQAADMGKAMKKLQAQMKRQQPNSDKSKPTEKHTISDWLAKNVHTIVEACPNRDDTQLNTKAYEQLLEDIRGLPKEYTIEHNEIETDQTSSVMKEVEALKQDNRKTKRARMERDILHKYK